MKRTKCMAIATLLLLAVSGAAAQSLGDYARTVRKNKPEPSSASRHYDNDNLPTDQALSVVGPPPSSDANADAAKPATVDPAPTAADRQKAADEKQKVADEWKKKIDDQKKKVDSLNHELDLDQREMRLRAAAAYTDPSVTVRDVNWNKDDERYKSDLEEKQKAVAAARQELDEMQEKAHKAGVAEDEKDSSKDNNKDSNKDK
jgi:hypothetical protein